MPKYAVTIGEHTLAVTIEENGSCTVEGRAVSIVETGPRQYRVGVGDRVLPLAAVGDGATFHVVVEGSLLDAVVESERARLLRALAGSAVATPVRVEILAPMPSLIVAVEVSAGDVVQPGQGLVILEAMKMENEIRAPHAGRVADVCVRKGQAVEKGQPLVLIDPAEQS